MPWMSFFIPNLRGEKGEMFSCTCENSVRISVCKGASYASGELILKPYIEQYSYLSISRPDTGISIPEVFHEIYKFEQFLSLATMRTVQCESIDLRDPEIRQDFRDGRKSYCFPIYVLTVQRPVFNPSKISRHKFLFCNERMPE